MVNAPTPIQSPRNLERSLRDGGHRTFGALSPPHPLEYPGARACLCSEMGKPTRLRSIDRRPKYCVYCLHRLSLSIYIYISLSLSLKPTEGATRSSQLPSASGSWQNQFFFSAKNWNLRSAHWPAGCGGSWGLAKGNIWFSPFSPKNYGFPLVLC